MSGRVTSLNLAVAAGVMLYDIFAKLKPDDLQPGG
jgi:tRNA G18 (ribose-2'-O)-methylase SpoU